MEIMKIIGEKVFADNASMVGGVGAVHRHLNFKKTLEDYDVYIQKYATSEYNDFSKKGFLII